MTTDDETDAYVWGALHEGDEPDPIDEDHEARLLRLEFKCPTLRPAYDTTEVTCSDLRWLITLARLALEVYPDWKAEEPDNGMS